MKTTSVLFLTAVALAAAQSASADDDRGFKRLRADLAGYNEVPSVSTGARGEFKARINDHETAIDWELSYNDLEAPVTQAHIHFGQRHVAGGISAFLCSNLGNGPAGTQTCPASPATITGTIMAAEVVGPAGQGIAAGQFDELVRAIRAGAAYANVHSTLWPAGEIRGQIRPGRAHGHD